MEESGPVTGKYVMETLQISDQVVMDCDVRGQGEKMLL